jgi:hypothetical protein
MSSATKVLPLKPYAPVAAQAYRVGRIVGIRDGQWLVDFPGNVDEPLLARTIVHPDAATMARAAAANADVLLLLEDDRPDLPIVIGLLSPPPEVAPQEESGARRGSSLEALVDGQRVVVEAQDEIVLRCGEASITLRRNGRIVVRGTYVETRSKGVNRIKGGMVQIN